MRDGRCSERRSASVPLGAGGTSRRHRCPRSGWRSVVRCVGVAAGKAALLALVVASPAGATFAGRNGVLLVSSTPGHPPFITTARASEFPECGPPSELWGVRPDGFHPVDLGRGDSGLFSPGGRRLAIYDTGDPAYPEGCMGSTPFDPRAGLYVSRPYAADHRPHRRRLMRISPDHSAGFVGWLPDGRLVAFQVNKPRGAVLPARGGLRLLDALTGFTIMTLPDVTTPFTVNPTGLASLSASMSCSGRLAAAYSQHAPFRSSDADQLDIFTRTIVTVRGVAHVRTATRVVIKNTRVDLLDPAWAPNGRSLLFFEQAITSRGAFGAISLWSVGANGRGLHELAANAQPPYNSVAAADNGVAADSPGTSWSPDGRHIFALRTSLRAGGPDVERAVVMNADGSHQHVLLTLSNKLTDHELYPSTWPVESAAWSPDSKSIAVSTNGSDQGSPATFQIWNATTGAQTTAIPNFTGNGISDWQALPGRAHQPRCADTAKPLPAPL
jgi:hypothetical protein